MDTAMSDTPVSLPATLEAELLSTPDALMARLQTDRFTNGNIFRLLSLGILCGTLSGVATGTFNGWRSVFIAGLKTPMIMLATVCLCFPTLLVFACISGHPLSLRRAVFVSAGSVAMIGFVLLGLAPINWLFAVSSESLQFVVGLSVVGLLISYSFCLRLFQACSGMRWWLVVTFLVLLQMLIVFRPIFPALDEPIWSEGKKLFLDHFWDLGSTRKTADSSSKAN